mmetsp:Transcript_101/g.300  ORF Transcript_101/g.300 Transcript_101/m.300 type:complete len:407 (+) Transcript_101:3744-4964(+)
MRTSRTTRDEPHCTSQSNTPKWSLCCWSVAPRWTPPTPAAVLLSPRRCAALTRQASVLWWSVEPIQTGLICPLLRVLPVMVLPLPPVPAPAVHLAHRPHWQQTTSARCFRTPAPRCIVAQTRAPSAATRRWWHSSTRSPRRRCASCSPVGSSPRAVRRTWRASCTTAPTSARPRSASCSANRDRPTRRCWPPSSSTWSSPGWTLCTPCGSSSPSSGCPARARRSTASWSASPTATACTTRTPSHTRTSPTCWPSPSSCSTPTCTRRRSSTRSPSRASSRTTRASTTFPTCPTTSSVRSTTRSSRTRSSSRTTQTSPSPALSARVCSSSACARRPGRSATPSSRTVSCSSFAPRVTPTPSSPLWPEKLLLLLLLPTRTSTRRRIRRTRRTRRKSPIRCLACLICRFV